MKIESEKAQVRISSLSKYQSLIFVLCSDDMKIKTRRHRCASRPCVCNICQRRTTLSNCQSFIYSCVKEGHEDSEKARVCISSLSIYQSFVSGFV